MTEVIAFVSIFVSFVVFTVLDYINYFRVKRDVEKEVKISETQARVWELKLEFENLIKKNVFKDCPYTRKYISSNMNLFIKDGMLNLREIYPSGSEKTEKIFQRMKGEIDKLPPVGRKYLCDFFDVVFDLAEIQRQLFTKSVIIKKKIALRIIDCLIFICHKTLNLYEKLHQIRAKFRKVLTIKNPLEGVLDGMRRFVVGNEYLKNVQSISGIIR